jgi:hypothetical protein
VRRVQGAFVAGWGAARASSPLAAHPEHRRCGQLRGALTGNSST